MPSTLVLNADLSVCPALRSWIGNNAELLKGFDLQIAEDVISGMSCGGGLGNLAITPTRAIAEGGDIELAGTILQGDVSGLIHFPSPSGERGRDVLSEPLVRAALLSNLPIALNPATASALVKGIKGSRRGYVIFNPVSGQGDPDLELAEIRNFLEPQIMLQVWMTKPGVDPGDQARDLIKEIHTSSGRAKANRSSSLQEVTELWEPWPAPCGEPTSHWESFRGAQPMHFPWLWASPQA